MPQTAPQRLEQGATLKMKKIAIIYGPPNSFKTRTLATAPNPMIIELEQSGLKSLAGSGALYWDCWAADPNDIIKNMRVAWAWIEKNAVKEQLKTVCIDSVTALLTACLDSIVKGDDTPNKKDYGEANRRAYVTLNAFWRLPVDIVMTAGVRHFEDEAQHLEYTSPDITPGLFRAIGGVATDGFYFTPPPPAMKVLKNAAGADVQITHIASVGANSKFWTKTRSLLPAVLPNPNLTHIFNLLDGKEVNTTNDKS